DLRVHGPRERLHRPQGRGLVGVDPIAHLPEEKPRTQVVEEGGHADAPLLRPERANDDLVDEQQAPERHEWVARAVSPDRAPNRLERLLEQERARRTPETEP